jgi:tellurite resistance protein
MPKRISTIHWAMTRSEIAQAYMDDHEDELLDAVVTAAALVAQADGRIAPVERGQLLDFLDRAGFLAVFTRADVFDAFEYRIRTMQEDGTDPAVERLAGFAGSPPARLVAAAAEEIARADRTIDPRERQILQRIRVALGTPPERAAPNDE